MRKNQLVAPVVNFTASEIGTEIKNDMRGSPRYNALHA